MINFFFFAELGLLILQNIASCFVKHYFRKQKTEFFSEDFCDDWLFSQNYIVSCYILTLINYWYIAQLVLKIFFFEGQGYFFNFSS